MSPRSREHPWWVIEASPRVSGFWCFSWGAIAAASVGAFVILGGRGLLACSLLSTVLAVAYITATAFHRHRRRFSKPSSSSGDQQRALS